MSSLKIYLFVAAVLAAAPMAHGDIKPSEIEKQIKGLRLSHWTRSPPS